MKIFIDTTKWLRIKEENEAPIVSGNNYVDKITVYYNSDPSNAFFPTLNILKPNNRVVGGVVADATETYPQQETIDGTTWYYFDFTLSANNHQIDVPGKYQITIVTNFYNSTLGTITGNRNINTFLVVQNAAVFDNGDIIVIGDDPSTVVASMLAIINSLQITINSINSNKADRNNDEQDIVAHDLTVDSLGAASGITINGVAVVDKNYTDTKAALNGPSQTIIADKVKVNEINPQSGGQKIDFTQANKIAYSATHHLFTGVVNADVLECLNTKLTLQNKSGVKLEFKDGFYFTDLNNNEIVIKDNTLTVNKVTGLATPTNNSDASNKNYVDTKYFALLNIIDDLKSVQNVVDVVATYAALEAYDTSDLETNDKIQVIADESQQDSPSTIYSYTSGGAWDYVGAYGGNSYTKTQTDAKLQAYAKLNDSTQEITANILNSTGLDLESGNYYFRVFNDGVYNDMLEAKVSYATIYSSYDIDINFDGVSGGELNINNADSYNFVNTVSEDTWGISFFEGGLTTMALSNINLFGTSTINMMADADTPTSVVGIATPTEATGAANKSYVDNTINSSFLTDAEMATLISEVFD